MILDPTYDTKTIDELQAEFRRLATDLAAISDKRAAVLALLEKRRAEASASVRVSHLTPVEKDALKRALESRTRAK